MIWLIGLLLTGRLVSGMKLPLMVPIEGFEKADEFLLSTRAVLVNSRFHLYVAPKEGPLVLTHFFSLSDSTCVYGMTPRLNCDSSRLVLFDQTVFEDQITKTKNDSAKKTPVKSGRGHRKQQPSRSQSRQVELDTVAVETKCASVVIPLLMLVRAYGSILSMIATEKRPGYAGFIGAAIENIDQESYAVHLFFAPDVSEEIITAITALITSEECIFTLNSSLNQVSLQLKPAKDMKSTWELRNHCTGDLFFSTGNRETLCRLLEWSRPENLWDLMLVREGEFEKMRRTGLSFAIGVYKRNTFHSRIIDHVDLVEMKGNWFMNFSLSFGFEDVLGFYFFKNIASEPEEMALASILYHQANEDKMSLGKVIAMESYNLAIEQFVMNNFLHNNPALTPETLPVPMFMRYKQNKLIEECEIKSLEDFLAIGERPWGLKGFSWSVHDKLVLFMMPERTLTKVLPYTLFFVLIFHECKFPLAFLRLYQLLLTHTQAWWAPCIKTITISPKLEADNVYIGLLNLTIVFHSDPLMKGWDVPKFLAEFILTASGEAVLFSGLIDNKTNINVSLSQDKKNVFATCSNLLSNRLYKLPGPHKVFRSNEDGKDYVSSLVSPDQAPKQVFEAISILEWEGEFRRLGPPRFFFEPYFLRNLDLTHLCRSFGIISEWIKQKGAARTQCFKIARHRVPAILAAVGTLAFGSEPILGTAFLGCMFEFDIAPTIATEEFGPSKNFVFTLLIDPAAGPEELAPVAKMLGISNDMPLDIYTCFLTQDLFENHSLREYKLSSPWLVKSDAEYGLHKVFANYDSLEHFVSWLDPAVLPSLSLLKVSDEIDPCYDGPVIYLSLAEEDVFEMIFALDWGKVSIPGRQMWDMVQKISFKIDPNTPKMILIGYHLKPDICTKLFENLIAARVQWMLIIKGYGLAVEEKMHVSIRIGGKYSTKLGSFGELQAKVHEFPGLKLGDQAIIWNNKHRLPVSGTNRAYHILIHFDFVPHILIRAIQFLAGTFGGFWSKDFMSIHIRPVQKKGDGNETHWELIWTFQNGGTVADQDYLTVLAKILLICGCVSPEYSVGVFNFKNGQFQKVKATSGIVDDYLKAVYGMMILYLPDWMELKLEKEEAEAKIRAREYELQAAQKAFEDYQKLSKVILEEAEEACKESSVLLKSAELMVEQKASSLETTRIHVKESEVQVREKEIRLKQAKEQVSELKNQETEKQKEVARLLEDEKRLDQILAQIAIEEIIEPARTVSVIEEQICAVKAAVKSSRRRFPTIDF